jgi:hypothetical protein
MNKLIEYINNNFRFFECLFFFIMIFIMLTNLYLDPVIKQNIDKSQKNKPTNREKITSNSVVGNVESIHPWGRTEIVPIKDIELEYFEYCDEWVMYGGVVQPVDRKDYFMPVMKGRLNLDVKDMTQTWIEYGGYETGSLEKPETYEDFRVANIRVKTGKIIDIKYTHYRLLSDKTWSIIASWKAVVNPDIPIAISPSIVKNDVPLIVCSSCKGKGQKPIDVNKLMMDAKLALFINHHLTVDKCDKCVKLPYGDAYDYCDTVQNKYQILVQEYAAAGPKISMAACDKCMGMGTFSSKDLTTGKWLTQKEHDEKSKKD